MKNIALLFLALCLNISAQEIMIQENFQDGIPDDWEIKSDNPKRKWYAKNYKDDYYLSMSAFGGKGKPGYAVTAELHTPLMDLTQKKCKLKFSFADAYQNGQPLHVYITDKNLNLIKQLDDDYWSELVNNSGRYDNIYEATDWIPLPQLDQPYRINFSYQSKKDNQIITTIIQLKDVDIWCTE